MDGSTRRKILTRWLDKNAPRRQQHTHTERPHQCPLLLPPIHKLSEQGIEVRAEPLELVASRRQQFQRRMSRHWLRLQEEAGGGVASTEGRCVCIRETVCVYVCVVTDCE